MKKSSPQQLETMVTFMEEHGDLSKPSNSAKGRIEMLRRWEQLTSLLNSNGTGDSKPTEKWRKDYPTVNVVDAAIENHDYSQVEQNQLNFTKRGNYLICETENSSPESQTTEEPLPKKTKLSTDSQKTYCDSQEEFPDSQPYDDNISYCKENDKYDAKDAFIAKEKEYQCNDFFGRIVALELAKFHGNMRYNKMKEILEILKE
ncbi:uncharacterized protein LOC121728701 [Aricia agestis]|uniref:uncharacterized protein LOC121728701 n=1 Tax=Aricia agestis TaxID=91739 RepID=UPI001C20530B|nr:uncharacterized protein LOC121728701 [Aricia agestis]